MSERDDYDKSSKNDIYFSRYSDLENDYDRKLKSDWFKAQQDNLDAKQVERPAKDVTPAQEKEAVIQANLTEPAEKYSLSQADYTDRTSSKQVERDAELATELAEYEKKKQDLTRWREGLRLEVQEIKRRRGIEEPKPQYVEPPKQVLPPPVASTGTGCVLVVFGALGFVAAVLSLPFFMKQLIALLW